MNSRVPRVLWLIFLVVMILGLSALVYLLITRSDLLRARNLNPAPGVYFYDDFSRFYSGWEFQQGSQGSTVYARGRYRISVDEPDLDLWGTAGLDLSNVSIEVNVSREAGPSSASAGILCRYQDRDNFYFGIITGEGYYGIGKYEMGGLRLLSGYGLQATDSVNRGSRVNHLRFDCAGSTLTLFVNGFLLASVEDTTFPSGDVGVIAGTLDEANAVFAFDDYVVFKP